eukprot:6211748-Pleurochrysis_carterae.AAC.2
MLVAKAGERRGDIHQFHRHPRRSHGHGGAGDADHANALSWRQQILRHQPALQQAMEAEVNMRRAQTRNSG